MSTVWLSFAGYGGGYMERDEVVEYVKREDSEDEFDEVSSLLHFILILFSYTPNMIYLFQQNLPLSCSNRNF